MMRLSLIAILALAGCTDGENHYLVRYCNGRHLLIHSLWTDDQHRYWVGSDWGSAQQVRPEDIDEACPK